MSKKTATLSLGFIILVSLGIRLYLALKCHAAPDFSDMAFYSEIALRPGFPVALPPGYPLFLRAIYAVFGALNYRAVFVVQGLISSCMVLLMFWITNRIGNAKAGLIAAGIAAVYPNFLLYNLTTLTETISLFFVCVLLAILVAPMSERKISILSALALCFGCVFRPALLFFAPGMVAGIRKRIIFIGVIAALVLPIILYGLMAGQIVQRGSLCFYKAYNPMSHGSGYIDPKLTALGRDDLPSMVYIKAALSFIRSNKWQTIEIVYNKAAIAFSRG